MVIAWQEGVRVIGKCLKVSSKLNRYSILYLLSPKAIHPQKRSWACWIGVIPGVKKVMSFQERCVTRELPHWVTPTLAMPLHYHKLSRSYFVILIILFRADAYSSGEPSSNDGNHIWWRTVWPVRPWAVPSSLGQGWHWGIWTSSRREGTPTRGKTRPLQARPGTPTLFPFWVFILSFHSMFLFHVFIL